MRKGFDVGFVVVVIGTILGGTALYGASDVLLDDVRERGDAIEDQVGGPHVELSDNPILAREQLRATTYHVTLRSVHCQLVANAISGGNPLEPEIEVEGDGDDDYWDMGNPHANVLIWGMTVEEESISQLECRGGDNMWQTVGVFEAQEQIEDLRGEVEDFTDSPLGYMAAETGSALAGAAKSGLETIPGIDFEDDTEELQCPLCEDMGNHQPGNYGSVTFEYPEDAESPLTIDAEEHPMKLEEPLRIRQYVQHKDDVEDDIADEYGEEIGDYVIFDPYENEDLEWEDDDTWNAWGGHPNFWLDESIHFAPGLDLASEMVQGQADFFYDGGEIEDPCDSPNVHGPCYFDTNVANDRIRYSSSGSKTDIEQYPAQPFRPTMDNVHLVSTGQPMYAEIKAIDVYKPLRGQDPDHDGEYDYLNINLFDSGDPKKIPLFRTASFGPGFQRVLRAGNLERELSGYIDYEDYRLKLDDFLWLEESIETAAAIDGSVEEEFELSITTGGGNTFYGSDQTTVASKEYRFDAVERSRNDWTFEVEGEDSGLDETVEMGSGDEKDLDEIEVEVDTTTSQSLDGGGNQYELQGTVRYTEAEMPQDVDEVLDEYLRGELDDADGSIPEPENIEISVPDRGGQSYSPETVDNSHLDYGFMICPGSQGKIQSNVGEPGYDGSQPLRHGMNNTANSAFPFVELTQNPEECVAKHDLEYSGDWTGPEHMAANNYQCNEISDIGNSDIPEEVSEFETSETTQLYCGLERKSLGTEEYWDLATYHREIFLPNQPQNFLDFRDKLERDTTGQPDPGYLNIREELTIKADSSDDEIIVKDRLENEFSFGAPDLGEVSIEGCSETEDGDQYMESGDFYQVDYYEGEIQCLEREELDEEFEEAEEEINNLMDDFQTLDTGESIEQELDFGELIVLETCFDSICLSSTDEEIVQNSFGTGTGSSGNIFMQGCDGYLQGGDEIEVRKVEGQDLQVTDRPELDSGVGTDRGVIECTG